MNSLVHFVSTYPAIAVVWFVGMTVSIGFCILARATHRRNVKERLASSLRSRTGRCRTRGPREAAGAHSKRRRTRSDVP